MVEGHVLGLRSTKRHGSRGDGWPLGDLSPLAASVPPFRCRWMQCFQGATSCTTARWKFTGGYGGWLLLAMCPFGRRVQHHGCWA